MISRCHSKSQVQREYSESQGKPWLSCVSWEQRKLGEVGKARSGIGFPDAEQGGTEGIPFFKVSDMNLDGNGNEMNHANNYVSAEQIAARRWAPITEVPAVFFAKVGAAVMLNRKRLCRFPFLLDNNTMAYSLDQNVWDADFAKALFETVDLTSLVQVGALPSYNAGDVEAMEIMLPTMAEQEKIGLFFARVDNLITLHQRKYDKLLSIKKSMLEKMFPRDGSKFPEIRFSGFTDPWEQRKLGHVFVEYSEKGHPELPALTIIQGGGTVRRDESERSLQYDKASLANYKMVNAEDFIVHLRSFEGGLEKATTLGIISPAYHTFHGEGTDSRFYYSYFRSKRFIEQDLKPHVYGIRDGRSIDIEGMKTIEIPWTSYTEQQVIGNYIDTMDNLITLHQRKLEKLKNIKKSMLEKMFV